MGDSSQQEDGLGSSIILFGKDPTQGMHSEKVSFKIAQLSGKCVVQR